MTEEETHAVNATQANENGKRNGVEQSKTEGCVNSPDPGRVSTEEPRQSSRAVTTLGNAAPPGTGW